MECPRYRCQYLPRSSGQWWWLWSTFSSLPRHPFQSLTRRSTNDDSIIWWIMNNSELTTFSSRLKLTLSAYTSTSNGQTFGIGGGTRVPRSLTEYASQSAVCLVSSIHGRKRVLIEANFPTLTRTTWFSPLPRTATIPSP